MRLNGRRERLWVRFTITVVLAVLAVPMPSFGQEASEQRVRLLEREVRELRRDLRDAAAASGFVVVLFGAFCALWAQNTGRNAWLWFFLGAFFNVVVVFVLLSKNSADKAPRQNALLAPTDRD